MPLCGFQIFSDSRKSNGGSVGHPLLQHHGIDALGHVVGHTLDGIIQKGLHRGAVLGFNLDFGGIQLGEVVHVHRVTGKSKHQGLPLVLVV